MQQLSADELHFQNGDFVYLFKGEEEEIWDTEKCIASYDIISGIAVKEEKQDEPKFYRLEISLEDERVLVLAQHLNQEETQEMVIGLFDFLGIEYQG